MTPHTRLTSDAPGHALALTACSTRFWLNVLASVVLAAVMAIAAVSSSGDTLPSAAQSDEPETCAYIIRSGDTLSAIARRLTGKASDYHEIMRHNGLASATIYPGDTLLIPRRLLRASASCPPESSRADVDAQVLADIESLVFADQNANGRVDADEPGVAGVTLLLVREGRASASDEQGLVVFAGVDPGEHVIGLEEATIPDGFALRAPATVLLTVTEGDRGFAAFGLQPSTPAE